jgi:hypothetical protein
MTMAQEELVSNWTTTESLSGNRFLTLDAIIPAQ